MRLKRSTFAPHKINDLSINENRLEDTSASPEVSMLVEATDAQNVTFKEIAPTKQKPSKRRPPLTEVLNPKKRQRSEKRPLPSTRFDQTGHFPCIDKRRSQRCKNEECDKKNIHPLCEV